MIENSIVLPPFVTASLTLGVSALIAALVLAWLKPASYRVHRIVWFAVLLNGIILVRHSIDLPVLTSDPISDATQAFDYEKGNDERQAGLAANSSVPGHSKIEPSSNQIAITNRTVSGDVPQVMASADSQNAESDLSGAAVGAAVPGMNWLTIWLAGVVAIVFAFVFRYVSVLRQVQNSVLSPVRWQVECDQACRLAGLTSTVPLSVHPRIGPMLALTPRGHVIVVPESVWQRMNRTQRMAVLKHEVAHYQRGDILTSLLSLAIATIHWFNPLAWFAAARFQRASEWACDCAAVTNEREQTDFARALLSISTSNSKYLVGASGIGSSNLQLRVKRMLTTDRRSSIFGQTTLVSLVLIIMFLSWVNVRLIAKSTLTLPPATIVNSVDDVDLEKQIAEFSDALSTQDGIHEQLSAIAKRPAGVVAISNAIAGVERELQRAATKTAIPEFFETQVNSEFLEILQSEVGESQADVAKISDALSEIKSNLSDDSEAGKIFRRFLDQDESATVLYFTELRKQVRPGRQYIIDRLGKFLVENNDGKLVVRESVKDHLMDQLDQIEDVEKTIAYIKEESREWAKEVLEKDDLHSQVKQRLETARGAVFVLASQFGKLGNVHEKIEEYFRYIESLFIDTAEGLVIKQEAREKLIQGMDQMSRLTGNAQQLRKSMAGITGLIDESAGQAERQVKAFFETELGLAVISLELNLQMTGVEGLADRFRAQFLQLADDGTLRVQEDHQEGVTRFAREMLRNNRRLRRELRLVQRQIDLNTDDKTAETLISTESKLILLEKVRNHLSRQQFDAWPVWMEANFQTIDGKHVIKDSSIEHINDLIESAKAIETEMAKNDF